MDTKAEEEASARRRRPRTQATVADIPLVRDPVGEGVREAFETFLKTYVRDYIVPKPPFMLLGFSGIPQRSLFPRLLDPTQRFQ